VIGALALIWGHRFLPISDYPDWIFEGSLAAKILQGITLPAYSVKHYPVPYAGTVGLLGLLDLVFSPEVSGKLVLSLCVVLFAASSIYLLKSIRHNADNPLLLIPSLFLTNTFFFWGELTYLLGLSLFFFYCGYLFRRIYRSEALSWWFITTVSIALFFFHFIPYATAILVTITLCVSESRTDLLYPAAVSFAPSIGLTIWYAFERLSLRPVGPLWEFWTPYQIAGRVIAAFSPFPEFLPWLGIQAPGMRLFALLNLAVTIALLLVVPICVVLWVSGRTRSTGVLACAVVCMVVSVASGYEFAGMVSPGERFLYPAVWIGLCWLSGASIPRLGSLFARCLRVVTIVLLVCEVGFMQVNVGAVSNKLAALYSTLRSASSQAAFCTTYEAYLRQSWDLPHRKGLDRLLTNHASAPRLPYYLYLERNVEEAPIFQIGILQYKGQGDNEDLCRSQ